MLPKIRNTPIKTVKAEHFGGITRYAETPAFFTELVNISSDKGHALVTADNSSRESLPSDVTGFLGSDKDIYTTASALHIGEETIPLMLSDGAKQIIRMGALIVILPDFTVVNTGKIPYEIKENQSFTVEGTVFEVNTIKLRPTTLKYKLFYIEAPENSVNASGIEPGDKLILSYTMDGKTRELPVTVSSIGSDFYTAEGCLDIHFEIEKSYPNPTIFYLENGAPMDTSRYSSRASATVRKSRIPQMDFVVEHRNRLWGCSSEKHEIYCSKLGNPLVFGEFSGISTDPWTATVGSDGDFTAAAVYGDGVAFFKENTLHTVAGTRPENFTVTEKKVSGVKSGNSGSVINLGGMLYYRGGAGIYCYNGLSSVRIDEELPLPPDFISCAAGNGSTLVFFSAAMLYIYDCERRIWHKENIPGLETAFAAFRRGDSIIFAGRKDDSVMKFTLHEKHGGIPLSRHFIARSGKITAGKGLFHRFKGLRLRFFADIPTNSLLNFEVRIRDKNRDEHTVYTFTGKCGINEIRLRPVRDDSIQLVIEGDVKGDAKLTLSGIYIECEEGSARGH